jgi:F-type H+-transporting ATPase subunit b
MLDLINVLAVTTEHAEAVTSSNPAEAIAKVFSWEPALFLAQFLNILIVLVVLYIFAFKPITSMLAQRKARIADGEAKLTQIQKQLADSEKNTAAAIAKANEEAQRLVTEAKESAAILSERKAQEAIAAAQQILAKAESAAKAERDLLKAELKREFGRLVTATTAQVTGKVLTSDDQQRLNAEALAKVEA